MKTCFQPTDILLPAKNINLEKWAVIACDQYTSQPEYWDQAAALAGQEPSAYHLIYPEAYMQKTLLADHRLTDASQDEKITMEMQRYLDNGILSTQVDNGFIFVVRTSPAGMRLGLMGALDLEQYEFRRDKPALIKATEETVVERIPPRMKIRQRAPLELPHTMVLIEDSDNKLIEPLYKNRQDFPVLYDTDLMLGGGHITGYSVTGTAAGYIGQQLSQMQEKASHLFLAVGDGNHSLAAAKSCWEKQKARLSLKEQENHPARYTLVELVNLYSPALKFAPIHRILYHVDARHLIEQFEEYLKTQNLSLTAGKELCFLWEGKEKYAAIQNRKDRLPVEILQKYLDLYCHNYPETAIDYIHGDEALHTLTASGESQNLGIALTAIDKSDLFPAIAAGGVLPRKTFSIGEAQDKRYYMECRRI